MENNIPTKTYERSKLKTTYHVLRFGELPIEFENVCRLCLEKHDTMYDMFKDDNIVPIVVKIKTLLTLRVEEEDDLPTMVCDNCLNKLNEFYKFKKLSIASDVKLRQYFIKNPLKQRPTYNDAHLNLEETSSDPKVLKSECTITWDEQVPLAGVITQLEDNKARKQKAKTKNCIPNSMSRNEEIILDQDEFHLPMNDNDYDEMPLAQRKVILKMIEDKTIDVSRRKAPRKITNVEVRCRCCNKFKSALSTCKAKKKDCTFKFKCPECLKTFVNNSTLKRHFRVHTGERPFKCFVCRCAFSQKETLTRHIMQTHNKHKPFMCKYCDKGFSLPFLLTAHLRTAHTIRPKYRCTHCPKMFTHASGLSRHKNAHTGVRYTCTECSKKFIDPSSFKRHMKMMHGNKNKQNS